MAPMERTIVMVNLNFGDAKPHATASKNGKPLEPPEDPEIELSVGDSLEFKSDRPFKIQISGEIHKKTPAGPKKNLFTGKDGEELELDSRLLTRNGVQEEVISGEVHPSFQQVERPCAYKYKSTLQSTASIDPHIIIK
jgi:hypothetical protein